jgi:hypothetical protein
MALPAGPKAHYKIARAIGPGIRVQNPQALKERHNAIHCSIPKEPPRIARQFTAGS